MKKIKNPLIKRIPKELIGDWKKYLVVFLFLVLTIGFVSGMYVANESMITSANEGVTKYKQEDGHFELKKQADVTLLSAIETGEKADVKQYYLDEAKKKLDKKLPKSLVQQGLEGSTAVGKDEVTSSNLVSSSRTTPEIFGFLVFSFDFGNFLNEYGFADFC